MAVKEVEKKKRVRGVVHGGTLGRWFEELCRIKHVTLSEIVASRKDKYRLRTGILPKKGGIYAFWWTGSTDILRSRRFNRHINLHGPGGRSVELLIDNEWLGLAANLPIPLYVGKNAQDISSRIRQHLLLRTSKRILPATIGATRHKAPTTTCQLRAGIEHLFLRVKNPIEFITSNVGLSYVILDGDKNAANRFYLEDLAVGLMRPPINVDVER